MRYRYRGIGMIQYDTDTVADGDHPFVEIRLSLGKAVLPLIEVAEIGQRAQRSGVVDKVPGLAGAAAPRWRVGLRVTALASFWPRLFRSVATAGSGA